MIASSPTRLFLALLGALLLAASGSGCVSSSGKSKPSAAPARASGGGPVDELDLLAFPAALNLNQSGSPNGFVVKIYASNHQHPKPVPIESGQIQILLFDGSPGLSGNELRRPLRTWDFTSDELKQFEIRTSIGTGYQMAPLWGDAKPTSGMITVVARYTSPRGQVITSAPSVISMGAN